VEKVTPSQLMTTARRLNDEAERLRIDSRYAVAADNTQGHSYTLIETFRYDGYEINTNIGKTAAEANWWLKGMLRAFLSIRVHSQVAAVLEDKNSGELAGDPN
jgi:hypothetical protein